MSYKWYYLRDLKHNSTTNVYRVRKKLANLDVFQNKIFRSNGRVNIYVNDRLIEQTQRNNFI